MRLLFLLLFVLTGVGSASAIVAAQERSRISVERPWARASIGTSRPAAAYVTLVNSGSETARLVGIESPVAGRAEIHRTVKQGDVLRMEPVGDMAVPASGRVVLEPGGSHIMLMDLKRPLNKGETFPLTLRFADGDTVEIVVPVMALGARGPGA